MAQKAKSGDWKKRESFGSAAAQVAAAALVLGGIGFWYFNKNVTREKAFEQLKATREITQAGGLANIEKGLNQVEDVFKIKDSIPEPHAFAANLHSQLWLDYQLKDHETKTNEELQKAIRGNAQNEDRYATEALVLLSQGKAQEAFDSIETLRQKGASGAKLSRVQAEAMVALGNLAMAKLLFASSLEKNWKDPQFGCAYGEFLLAEGNTYQAADAFQKALNQAPENARAKLGLAMANVLRKEKLETAVKLTQEAMQSTDATTPAIKARTLTAGALLANADGKYDDAIKMADNAVQVNPSESWALYAKGVALAQKKEPNAAHAFEAAVQKSPNVPYFYFDGAHALQKNGQADASIALLDKFEARFKAIRNKSVGGEEVAALDRDDRYWLARGDALKAKGNLDAALAAYDKAIAAKNLLQAKAYYAKGAVFIEQKQVDKALEILADITPDDGKGSVPEAYMALGKIQFEKKDYETACKNFGFALTRMKMQRAPKEDMVAIVTDVEKKLKAAGKIETAKEWVKEATPITQ